MASVRLAQTTRWALPMLSPHSAGTHVIGAAPRSTLAMASAQGTNSARHQVKYLRARCGRLSWCGKHSPSRGSCGSCGGALATSTNHAVLAGRTRLISRRCSQRPGRQRQKQRRQQQRQRGKENVPGSQRSRGSPRGESPRGWVERCDGFRLPEGRLRTVCDVGIFTPMCAQGLTDTAFLALGRRLGDATFAEGADGSEGEFLGCKAPSRADAAIGRRRIAH